MIELVEEIFGTREVLVASRAVQNVSRPVFSGLSGQLNEPVSLEMVLRWMDQWWLYRLPSSAITPLHAEACQALLSLDPTAGDGPWQQWVVPLGRAAPFSSLAQAAAGSGIWNRSLV